MNNTKPFDLAAFIERAEALINTKKGTMLNNPSYGFDWDLFKTAVLTKNTLIKLEDSANESMRYFTKNDIVSSLDVSALKKDSMTVQLVINCTVHHSQFTITTEPINLSTGEYQYVKFFPIQ